jgi:hypothetical protein
MLLGVLGQFARPEGIVYVIEVIFGARHEVMAVFALLIRCSNRWLRRPVLLTGSIQQYTGDRALS